VLELLTGPAGSGKTTFVLDSFRRLPESARPRVRVLTPTATMAEHLRNLLAREGLVFSPGLILTLSRFAGEKSGLARPPAAALLLAVKSGLAARPVPALERIADAPGLNSTLARAIEELASAGCRPQDVPAGGPLGVELAGIFEFVIRDFAARGWALQSERLREAAAGIRNEGTPGIDTILLDGFFSLTDPEIEFIEALARSARVVVTVPDSARTSEWFPRLEPAAARVESLEARRPRLVPEIFTAPSIEEEARAIAHRILCEIEAGRRPREIGIVLRSPETYVPALEEALERYRIPARFYFDPPLAAQSPVCFFAAVMDAMLGGWDWERTLAAVRARGVSSDAFDFAVRARIPGRGLEGLRSLPDVEAEVRGLLEGFAAIEAWSTLREPAPDWARRMAALCSLWRPAAPPEFAVHSDALVSRARSAAVAQFAEALTEAGACLDPEAPIPAQEFWEAARAVLSIRTLSAPDHRRDVVHVLSVYEARQWELPVVFVCGLLEKQFPRHHSQDPILPDSVRKRLNAAGFRVRTAADRDAEERLLFDLAITRATARLLLSYPAADAKGAPTLPSLLLNGMGEACPAAAAPLPGPVAVFAPRPGIGSPTLEAGLARRHRAFSPSSLETFLRCPFQFFARQTLRLMPPPPRPRERITPLLEGAIIHDALSLWHTARTAAGPLFDGVFDRKCREAGVPEGYVREAARLRLGRDIEQFTGDPRFEPGAGSISEKSFEWSPAAGVVIRGRIDRIDSDPRGFAVVIDYKYSGAQRLRDSLKKASLLQGPLYALACENALGKPAGGIFYLGVKKDIVCIGWGDGFPKGAPLDRAWLEERLETALAATASVRAGRNEPAPEEPELCELCDYRGVCRHG
jgi:RecB family exonuclease